MCVFVAGGVIFGKNVRNVFWCANVIELDCCIDVHCGGQVDVF